jgi:hypothetical protein
MKTVVKHEAFAVAKQRARHGTPSEACEIEPHAGRSAASHEVAERRERLRLGAEALGRLKPQEVRALLLRADGLSYREICAATGWTYTKVNRCLSEGRQSFLDRVAGIEGGAECERLAPVVSLVADGEASAEQVAAVRPHLSGCLACRARLREYRRAPARAAAAVAPIGIAGSLRWLVHGAVGQVQGVAAQLPAGVAAKAAAVAAGVAVAGGGGLAVVHHRSHPGPSRPRVIRSTPSSPPVQTRAARASSRPAPPRASVRPRSDGQLRVKTDGRSPRDRAVGPPRAPHEAPSGATGEFTPTPPPAHARPAHAPASPPQPAPPDPPGGEFAP